MEFVPLIKEGIPLIKSEKQRKVGVYYASESDLCHRKLFYSYLEEPHHNLDFYEAVETGSAFHRIVQNALEAYVDAHHGVAVRNEPEDVQRIHKEDDWEIHGRTDTMFWNTDGKMHILEIKSTKNLRSLDKARLGHLMQINYYLHFYPDAEGHILYMNKTAEADDRQSPFDEPKKYELFREYSGIRYSDELFKVVVDRVRLLHGYLISGTLPPAEAYLRGGENDWECRSCPARQECYAAIRASE